MSTPVSPVIRHSTTVAVVAVAGIAAAVSYSHMQQLADHAGEGWRSWLIPISIDGLVVAASMVLLTRRRAGLPGGWLAWGALSAGVLASLAANIADAKPELWAQLIAGWPAAAFAVAFELLLQQRRAESAAPSISDPGPSEPGSGGLGRPGSDPAPTQKAPLGHSGNPAGQTATVLPGRDSLGSFDPLPRPAPIDVESVRPFDPGSGADRLSADQPSPAGSQGPLVRTVVPVVRAGEGRPAATNAATAQAPRRDKPRDTTATSGATRRATKPRQTPRSTAEERRVWVRQQRDSGRTVTGADVHEQFPDAPRDGARIVRQVAAELDEELRAVAAGER